MKRILAASLLAIEAPVNAQVSSTAAPVANSSGSVTNQAVQVVPSRQFQSTFGNGISCQGTTLNISPFISSTTGWSHPYESYYNDPVYDPTDLVGATDPDGNPMPDGVPDNPGSILYMRPIRTGQKTNLSINGGITAQISIPLDRQNIRLCRKAAASQIELYEAALADKRLSYELARLKNCSENLKKGVMFHPDSPYAKICSDIVLVNPPGVLPPHIHEIPKVEATDEEQESPDSGPAEPVSAQREKQASQPSSSESSSSQS